jgi:hypothetical protein
MTTCVLLSRKRPHCGCARWRRDCAYRRRAAVLATVPQRRRRRPVSSMKGRPLTRAGRSWMTEETLNAYLKARRGRAVNLERFRTLSSSTASGAQQIKRLTNFHRRHQLVDAVPQRQQEPRFRENLPAGRLVPLKGRFPAIPRSDSDLTPAKHLQAIANTAGSHFATIEQGGTSLYPSLGLAGHRSRSGRVLLSTGPTETMHFHTWSDKAGNAPPLSDRTNGLVFPDLNSPPFGGPEFQTNLIMTHPTSSCGASSPGARSSVRPRPRVRPMGALKFLTDDGLFRGQSPPFFKFMKNLAVEADAPRRGHV